MEGHLPDHGGGVGYARGGEGGEGRWCWCWRCGLPGPTGVCGVTVVVERENLVGGGSRAAVTVTARRSAGRSAVRPCRRVQQQAVVGGEGGGEAGNGPRRHARVRARLGRAPRRTASLGEKSPLFGGCVREGGRPRPAT